MTKTGPPPGVSASLLKRMAELGLIREPTHYRLVPGPGAVLDVGCGQNKWPGAVGLDISPDTAADVVADLNEFPYPLEDGRFDQILCQDVIEHVREPLRFLSELHRVAKPGARIHVRTPHFSSLLAYGDPTHEHIFSALAFRTLEHQIFPHYLNVGFRVVDVTLDFWDPLRWIGVAKLANRFPGPYETLFAFRYPAMNIRAELEVLK
jgi:SAM-dependent methyltransferase